jgi:hypothetical protein
MKLSINLRNWGPYSTRELVLEFARAYENVTEYRRTIALLEEQIHPALS